MNEIKAIQGISTEVLKQFKDIHFIGLSAF